MQIETQNNNMPMPNLPIAKHAGLFAALLPNAGRVYLTDAEDRAKAVVLDIDKYNKMMDLIEARMQTAVPDKDSATSARGKRD